MENKSKNLKINAAHITLAVFFISQVMFATVIQLTNSIVVKFSSVVACFIFAVVFFCLKKRHVMVLPALLFTVVADIFMVLYQNYLPAILFFSVVQGFYFIILYQIAASKEERIWNILTRIVAVVVLEAVAFGFMRQNFSLLIGVSVAYYATLLTNVVFAGIHIKDYPQFFAGLVLFLLCDTSIAFIFMDNYVPLSTGPFGFLVDGSFNYVWLFYNISQFLLAIMPLVPKNPIYLLKSLYSND